MIERLEDNVYIFRGTDLNLDENGIAFAPQKDYFVTCVSNGVDYKEHFNFDSAISSFMVNVTKGFGVDEFFYIPPKGVNEMIVLRKEDTGESYDILQQTFNLDSEHIRIVNKQLEFYMSLLDEEKEKVNFSNFPRMGLIGRISRPYSMD